MDQCQPPPPKLLDQVRLAIRSRHYSRRTEEAYVYWIRKYILFHGKRHPRELNGSAVAAFLGWLAVERCVSASTQNQVLSALVFLYNEVLRLELGAIEHVSRAKASVHLPVMLSVAEVRRVLDQLADVSWPLSVHLDSVKALHAQGAAAGFGRVVLPGALDRKYPGASQEWRWQFVFPAGRICRDLRFGPPSRYHLHESAVQRAVSEAARRAGLTKRVTCHTFRHHADSRIMPRAA